MNKKIVEHFYGSWSLKSKKKQGCEVLAVKIISLESFNYIITLCYLKTCLQFIFNPSIFFFFSIRVFFHIHWRLKGQQGKGGDHLLFHSTTSTRSWTFRHLLATLHVRWVSHIFNHIARIYQTATRWDLPPYQITISLIDDVTLSFCLITWWFDSSFFVTAVWDRKPVDSHSHRLSPMYCKWTN